MKTDHCSALYPIDGLNSQRCFLVWARIKAAHTISTVVQAITQEMLQIVWVGLEYRLEIFAEQITALILSSCSVPILKLWFCILKLVDK